MVGCSFCFFLLFVCFVVGCCFVVSVVYFEVNHGVNMLEVDELSMVRLGK